MYISFSATNNVRTAYNVHLALPATALLAYVLRITPNIGCLFCKRPSRRKKYLYFKYPELKLRATKMPPLWGFYMYFTLNSRYYWCFIGYCIISFPIRNPFFVSNSFLITFIYQ